MAQAAGKARFRALRAEGSLKEAASPLYRWLMLNYEDISSVRQPGDPWAPYLTAAIEDGVYIEDRARGLRAIRRMWDVVQKLKRKRRTTPDDEPPPPARTFSHAPSRADAGWRPPLSEASSPVHGEGQRGAPVGEDSSSKKNTSLVASLQTTVPAYPGATENGEDLYPVGRARAEVIKRDLLERLKRKEPGF
ncbi:hypothetical protein GOB93_15590 [Acetobacter musti]|uniref:Uncharacterized protein n=1 Tax=Acetobacter musti TaxID=864732 RepID=A0ABX0JTF0_9PROT|nr:hypothetical protein [Acetobacter musti]NHN86053.1 hypothetical protein [Acetobacter musti]